MTRSAISHMRHSGPRDIAARMGVVRPGAWQVGDVGIDGIRRYRRDAFGPLGFGRDAVGIVDRVTDRTATIASRDAMRRRREH